VTSSSARGALRPAVALLVLSLINLLNYLDRYLVAGVLPRIESAFNISHGAAGAVGTVFIVVYMLVSPFAGYLGDRIPRRVLVAGSVFIWSTATFASGLAQTYPQLLLARALIGVGEAGYGAVAPALIADLFPAQKRTQMLSLFYVAIPVGAAMGYMVGGGIAAAHSWQMAFFVGGVPGIFLALAMLFAPEPPRGLSDGASDARVPFLAGVKELSHNRIYWVNTVGYTLLTFSVGGLGYWMPAFLELERGMSGASANFIFGAITASAGLTGTLAGGALGGWAERRWPSRGGMYVVGAGLLCAFPFMILATVVRVPTPLFVFVFLAQFLIFMNSGPINAALVSSVSPGFRAFAMGLNSLCIHLFGDAVSPPAIGVIAEKSSLAAAIRINAVPVLLGGVVLVIAAFLLRAPRQRAPAHP
jgi:MFS family permease